ncbi:peptidyl-tRNA hydrolase [Pseudomonas putida]|uniref:peptidyl-tRNA hydrolase n=1 Tax=Pseudomonas putida TaxID=303 RepID=A0A8I1JIE3_PSEPU|nr:peptidyl-tRNA hydrolase [Pseudomonas putida]MBI6882429.1 peptidyl-tRNA hydrolase [Pseudomonas putida]
MANLEVLMRTDLKMRTGKMVAQSGHAGMRVVTSRLRKRGSVFSISAGDEALLRQFVESPEVRVSLVFGQNDLTEGTADGRDFHLIIDNGATEFAGVRTMTCGASGIFPKCQDPEDISVADTGVIPPVRQFFILSREGDASKAVAMEMAVIGCVTELHKLVEHDVDSGDFFIDPTREDHAFGDWILNGYPKIGLQVPTHGDLDRLKTSLSSAGITSTIVERGACKMLVTTPSAVSKISPVTSTLKLM